ncbi:TIGR01458 family HAD-type hydrolase [Litoribacillus peritrichatus]|uniref:Haloacid dehalogenase-like hydrolase domain-containing protein 2 n=1 Tax=Litoribacillus peritrichatus TaxID=718191 RepID=A0ABP7MVV3_9GAMM
MIKAIFFDLSGVLYEGSQPIPGAIETINRLEKGGLTLRFITNTSRKTHQNVLTDLHNMGFDIPPEQLFTACESAVSWCEKLSLRPYCLVHKNIQSAFKNLQKEPFNAVIIGDAELDLNYQNLDRAFQILLTGAPLIAIGVNKYFKADDGLHLDAGPFVKALEFASGAEAMITGKPSPILFQQVMSTTEFKPSEILMIGDDVFSDIKGARDCGLETCLVKTGKYREGDEAKITPPTKVAKDVVHAVNERLPML